MDAMSTKIHVKVNKEDSRVLAFIISNFSIGESVGLKVSLELGEYVLRKKSQKEIFAIAYQETRLIEQSEDDDDLEDALADTIEEMLEKFSNQYKADNQVDVIKGDKKATTHKTFANDMEYETDYKKALANAKKEKKPLFIFMTTNYCPWCRKMEDRLLSYVEIDEKIKKKYLPLVLNLDKKDFPEALQKIKVTPALYIVNSTNEKIEHSFVGYHQRYEFLDILKK